MKPRMIFHVISVVVLAAAVVAAQSPKDKQKQAQTNQTEARESSSPSLSEREVSTGMASGRRQHQPVTITARETGSGMASGRKVNAQLEGSQPSASEAGVVTARESGSGMATGRAAYNSGPVTARETGSGMATGKIVSGDPHEYLNSRNSAHATESLDGASKDAGKVSEAQSNPMYKDGGLQGSNPMYQGKDRTAAPSSSGNGSKPSEYKDGEDGTTRTRPGNHKPAK